MLRIRDEQIEVLNQDARLQFLERLEEAIAPRLPNLSAAARRAYAENAIATGANDGIRVEADILDLLDWMIRHGEEFETESDTAWTLEVLEDHELNGSAKMAELTRRAAEESA